MDREEMSIDTRHEKWSNGQIVVNFEGAGKYLATSSMN